MPVSKARIDDEMPSRATAGLHPMTVFFMLHYPRSTNAKLDINASANSIPSTVTLNKGMIKGNKSIPWHLWQQ